MSDANEVMEVIAQILIRCFLLGLITLLFWFGALTVTGGLTYRFHALIVPITQQQFDVIHYTGILMTKAVIFIFFLFPYIAIRLVMRQYRR